MDGSSSNNSATDIDISELTYFNAFDKRLNARVIVNEDELSRCFRVTVKGYNPGLPKDEIKAVLSRCFWNCGNICGIVIPREPGTPFVKSRGCIYFDEESGQENAMALDGKNTGYPFPGRDLGGWTLRLKALPPKPCQYSPDQVADAWRVMEARERGFCVGGYPTWLPAADVKRALYSLFSTCGDIVYVTVDEDHSQPGHIQRRGFVCLSGEEAYASAVELDGHDMGQWKLSIVTLAKPGDALYNAPDANTYPTCWEGPFGSRWIDLHPPSNSSQDFIDLLPPVAPGSSTKSGLVL